jgi:hypothetical protein
VIVINKFIVLSVLRGEKRGACAGKGADTISINSYFCDIALTLSRFLLLTLAILR